MRFFPVLVKWEGVANLLLDSFLLIIYTSAMPELIQLHCLRCDHHWVPRIPNPVQCPKCKSLAWMKVKYIDVSHDLHTTLDR